MPVAKDSSRTFDLTVAVAVYNVAGYLPECLDSIIAQSGVDMEILCIDDGSTDDSAAILDEYAGRDARVRIIRHETNRGLLGVRKTGSSSALGRYLMFVDGDDVLAPDACRLAVGLIAGGNTDLAVFGVDVFSRGDIDVCYDNHFKLVAGDVKGEGDYPVLKACFVEHRFPWNLWNKIYRTEIVRKAAGLLPDEKLTMAEDLYFFFIIASQCKSAAVIPDKLYRYRVGNGVSTTTGFSPSLFEKRCRAVVCLQGIHDYACSLHPSPVVDQALAFCFDKVSEIIATVFMGAMPANERGMYLARLRDISDDLYERILQSLALNLMPLASECNRVFEEWRKANAEAKRCLGEWEKAHAEAERCLGEWEKAHAEAERCLGEWEKADAEARRCLTAWEGANAEVERYRSMSVAQFARERISDKLTRFFNRSKK